MREWWEHGYLLLAAVAGAVASQSAEVWQNMSPTKAIISLIIGSSFAIFVTPLVLHSVFGVNDRDLALISGVTFIMAAGSNILIPRMIERLSHHAGKGGSDEQPR